ncbi:hypothetical protein GCM10020295_39860 [Streptomyces cinereospinus]
MAVRPAKPVAPRPVVRPVAVPDDGAGVPCPACGTPNQPGRRFCRRCAAVLNPTASPDPLPWWRTVWPFRRRVRASSGRAWRFLVILAVVLALCAAGFLLLPAGRALLEDTRDKLGKPKPVTPVGVEASAEVPGHPVGNTLDGLNNRYWGAPAPGASVTYTFRRPFRLFDLIVTNGPSAGPQEYPPSGPRAPAGPGGDGGGRHAAAPGAHPRRPAGPADDPARHQRRDDGPPGPAGTRRPVPGPPSGPGGGGVLPAELTRTGTAPGRAAC